MDRRGVSRINSNASKRKWICKNVLFESVSKEVNGGSESKVISLPAGSPVVGSWEVKFDFSSLKPSKCTLEGEGFSVLLSPSRFILP